MINYFNLRQSKELPKLFSVFLDQGFMSVTTLLTSIVLARTYDKVDYADLVLLFSITLFVLGFQSSITSKPYALNLNDFDGEESSDYYQFNLYGKIVFTLFFIAIFPFAFYGIFGVWDIEKFFLFTLYIVFNTSYFFIRETLLSERKTKLNLIYGICCAVSLILLLLVILYFQMGSIKIFLGFSSLIYAALTLVYFIKHFRISKIFKKEFRSYFFINWKVGKWLLGTHILYFLSSGIYPWLLLFITTKSDIAVLGVLTSISAIMNPVLTSLNSYLLPLFVRHNSSLSQVVRLVKKWGLLFGILAVLLVLIGFGFGQDIIILLFGDKYSDLGNLVFYPFIIQAIVVLFQPLKIAMSAIKRTDIDFRVYIPRSIITVIFGYFLIQKDGLIGVFYTMIIENLTYQLLYSMAYTIVIHKRSSEKE